MEEERERELKKPLDLDWDKLLPSQDDDPPPDLVVTATATATATANATADDDDGGATADQNQKQHSAMGTEQQHETERMMSDRELNEAIRRQTTNIEVLSPRLPDKGEKLRATLKRLEDERERRKLCRLDKDACICEKPAQSNSLSLTGASNGFRQEDPSSQVHSQSSFGSHFNRKMEEDTDRRTVNAFEKELSYLGRCDRRKMKVNGQASPKGRQKSRQFPFQCSSNLSLDKGQHILSNGDQNGKASSICSLRHLGGNLPRYFAKKRDASQVLPSDDLRPRKTVVLVDEEESQLVETPWKADKQAECLKETTIYYPSRDDPESIEIRYSDIGCLAPETYLTSTIMNFYIRYLQQPASPIERAYHFFNTYFYKKLKEAVSYKGGDKKTFFGKFRRWWKGVNIFQKAYILLPIHEDLHWSLVIIRIPDKEDESGPIILHLDSLGFHHSRKIFDNIKSYLREEWDYLNQEGAAPDLPIADRIWKHLPRRIDEKIISVPQQKNDYDCGLFVLFFMERFIEEAPERLKKKDLAMFGKQWFKPEEASGLRGKIRNLLQEEFQKASADSGILRSLPLSSGGVPAESI